MRPINQNPITVVRKLEANLISSDPSHRLFLHSSLFSNENSLREKPFSFNCSPDPSSEAPEDRRITGRDFSQLFSSLHIKQIRESSQFLSSLTLTFVCSRMFIEFLPHARYCSKCHRRSFPLEGNWYHNQYHRPLAARHDGITKVDQWEGSPYQWNCISHRNQESSVGQWPWVQEWLHSRSFLVKVMLTARIMVAYRFCG